MKYASESVVCEAVSRADKFLDEAASHGLREVRIVHGHGTGRLRGAVAAFLAKHLPTRFDELKSFDYGAPLGVTDKTVMREIQLPQDAFVREVGLTPDSPYLWGADLQHNRLLRVDPETGDIHVLDMMRMVVLVFDAKGNFLSEWGLLPR